MVSNSSFPTEPVLAMSGHEIWMDYHSCLGPIDPQLFVEGHWVPALSYLEQYERLIEKSRQGILSAAELVLLGKFDLAALHRYEDAFPKTKPPCHTENPHREVAATHRPS